MSLQAQNCSIPFCVSWPVQPSSYLFFSGGIKSSPRIKMAELGLFMNCQYRIIKANYMNISSSWKLTRSCRQIKASPVIWNVCGAAPLNAMATKTITELLFRSHFKSRKIDALFTQGKVFYLFFLILKFFKSGMALLLTTKSLLLQQLFLL